MQLNLGQSCSLKASRGHVSEFELEVGQGQAKGKGEMMTSLRLALRAGDFTF